MDWEKVGDNFNKESRSQNILRTPAYKQKAINRARKKRRDL